MARDGQGLEDGQADDADVGAGAGDDEALVQGREGELPGAGRQEGQRARDLAEHGAVEALLLALLAEDGGDGADDARVAVTGGEELDILEGAEDDVGEGGCKGNGLLERRDWEVILAGLDGS